MRTAIGTILANKTVSSLSDVKQLGSALSQVTLVKEEVTVDIQVKHNVLVLKRLKWSYMNVCKTLVTRTRQRNMEFVNHTRNCRNEANI